MHFIRARSVFLWSKFGLPALALVIAGCCASSEEVRDLENRGGYFIPRNEGIFVNCDVERVGFHDHGQITDDVLAELRRR